jgi:hypothetical protein
MLKLMLVKSQIIYQQSIKTMQINLKDATLETMNERKHKDGTVAKQQHIKQRRTI